MTCLVCFLVLAVIMDMKSYRINNHLIIFGLVFGSLFHFGEYGWTSISLWLFGILLPVLFLFPLFLIKALGAGDIKLFSVIGCFYGITYVYKSVMAAFIIAAFLSLIYLIRNKQVFLRLHHLVSYIRNVKSQYLFKKTKTKESVYQNPEYGVNQDTQSGAENKPEPYYDRERDGSQGIIHFSPAILISVLLQVIFHIY